MLIVWLWMTLSAQTQYKAAPFEITLSITRHTKLDCDEPPVEITSFQELPNGNMLILDTGLVQQAYLFDVTGKLVKLIGRPGPGPGEYRMPGGLCLSGDRIHMISAGRRYLIFDNNGVFIKQRVDTHPGGIGAKIYPGNDGTAYFTCYKRDANATVYYVNKDGDIISEFSPADEDFSNYWVMLHPMANLVIEDDGLMQIFIHKYEVLKYDRMGNLIKKFPLASSLYKPPDFRKARKLATSRSRKALNEFQYTHTLVNSFYKISGDYVTTLNSRDSEVIEFWDARFFGLGRYQVPGNRKLVGVTADELVFFDQESSSLSFYRWQRSSE